MDSVRDEKKKKNQKKNTSDHAVGLGLFVLLQGYELWEEEYKDGSRSTEVRAGSSQSNSPSREICVFFRRDGNSFNPLPSDLIPSPTLCHL